MSRSLVLPRRLMLVLCAVALAVAASVPSLAGVASAQDDARVIETAFGEVEVPANPERVVVLNEQALDTALAVGVTPIGTVSSRGVDGVAEYLQEQVPDIEIVGTARETNFESVVALEPDLILAAAGTDQETYDLLSGIAPTVVPEAVSGAPWQDLTRFYAAALGKDAEIEQVLAEIDARIEELSASLGDNAGATVTVVRWMPNGPMVMAASTFTGQILQALGLQLPEFAQEIEGAAHSDVLSLENLAEIDTDWIFIATLNAEGADALEAAMSEPAFEQLAAAQAGQVVPVNGQLWSSTAGPLAAQAILDDIENALVGEAA